MYDRSLLHLLIGRMSCASETTDDDSGLRVRDRRLGARGATAPGTEGEDRQSPTRFCAIKCYVVNISSSNIIYI